MIKEELFKNIKSKPIIIWGLGEKGISFYTHYRNDLEIEYGTSNDKKQISGLNRIEPYEAIKQNDSFIVICSGYCDEIAYELIKNGKRWGIDFLSSDWLEAILSNKKILLSVGQCELAITNYIFRNLTELKDEYYCAYFDEYKLLGIQDKKPVLEVAAQVDCVIGFADYFIYPVNLSKERLNYYNDLLKKISNTCVSASVPLTTFEGYWPQDRLPYYEIPQYYTLNANKRIPFGGRRDINVEDLLGNKEKKEIMKTIEDENYYSDDEVEKNIIRSIKHFQILERKSDIKISDFILKNYKKIKIYRDRGHASVVTLREYAFRILSYLNISDDMRQINKVDLSWYEENQGEFPIYASVRKKLGFQENDYLLILRDDVKKVDFSEYMNIYIDYMETAKKLYDMGV